jgi:hypothetical protein
VDIEGISPLRLFLSSVVIVVEPSFLFAAVFAV